MDVKQIYTLVNTATEEALGTQAVAVDEDLSNLVDVGSAVFNNSAVDGYVKSLINRIGKMVFVNRPYAGSVPSLLMDGWEFGSVMMKSQAELPAATENESWELENLQSYDPNIYYKPTVSNKFFNKKTTFEVPISFAEKQVKQSFVNAEEMNAFLSMIETSVYNTLTIKTDALIMRTINNMIADTVYSDYGSADIDTKSGVKAVNLLYLYNHATFTSSSDYITAAQAIHDSDFIRYAAFTMGLYKDRMAKVSALFNMDGKARFTPADRFHCVLLSEFKTAAAAFLQSDTFNKDLVALPASESVPYWQGSGTDYGFSSTGKIDVITANNHNIAVTGVLGVMFDRDAMGVTNMDKRVTTNYNPRAEFYSNWYKQDASYFNASDENCVVFFVA